MDVDGNEGVITSPKNTLDVLSGLSEWWCMFDETHEHWKVRIHIRGTGMIHAISSSEPRLEYDGGLLKNFRIEPIEGTEFGDTIGHIDIKEISAITWRHSPKKATAAPTTESLLAHIPAISTYKTLCDTIAEFGGVSSIEAKKRISEMLLMGAITKSPDGRYHKATR